MSLQVRAATLFCCSYVKSMSTRLLLLTRAPRDRVYLVWCGEADGLTMEELCGNPSAEIVATFPRMCMSHMCMSQAAEEVQHILEPISCDRGWYEMCPGVALKHLAVLFGAPRPKPTHTLVKLSKDDRKLLAEGRLHAPGIITLLEGLFDEVRGLKKQLTALRQTAQAQPCPTDEPLEQLRSQATELDADCQAERGDCLAPDQCDRESEQIEGATEAALESMPRKEEAHGKLEDPAEAAPSCEDAPGAEQGRLLRQTEHALLWETLQTSQTPLGDNAAPEDVAGEEQQPSKVQPADFESDKPETMLQATSKWEPEPAFEQRYDDLTDVSSLDGDESPAHERVKLYAKARRIAKAANEATKLRSELEAPCEHEPENTTAALTVKPKPVLLLRTVWKGGKWVHVWESALQDTAGPEQELTEKAQTPAADALQDLLRAEQPSRKRGVEDLENVTPDNAPSHTELNETAEPEGKKPRLAHLKSATDVADARGGQQDLELEQSLSPKGWGVNLSCEKALEPPVQQSEPEPACLEAAQPSSEAELACKVALKPCARQDAKTPAQIRKEAVLLLGKKAADCLLADCQEKILRDGRGGVQRFLVDSAGATLTLVHRKNVAPE